MHTSKRPDPDGVLQDLLAGNRRFALGAGTHPHQTLHHRDELLNGQNPAAAVICCSDSRVPPEIIFDCGLGDLFVVRAAAHILDDAAAASLQYAVRHLGVEVILVLGHGDCGAIRGAMGDIVDSGALGDLLKKLQPVVAAVAGRAGDQVENAVIENVRQTKARLQELEWPAGVVIRGAFFSLKSGLVRLDPEI